MKKGNLKLGQIKFKGIMVGIMKSTRIRWAGHVWRSELVLGSTTRWRTNTNRPLGRPRQRWDDRIKDDLRISGRMLLLCQWTLVVFKMS